MGPRERERPRADQPGRVGAGRRAGPAHRRLDHRRARGAAGPYSAKAAGRGELSAGVRPAAARRGVYSAAAKPGAGGAAGTGTGTRRPLASEQRHRTAGRVGRAGSATRARTSGLASAGRPRLGSTGTATAARRLGRVGGIAHTRARAIRVTAASATF